jgi:hypothetical protein
MCWLWILNVVRCMLTYAADSGFVVAEAVRFVGVMRARVFNILSVPGLMVGKQIATLSYGYLEELEVVLGGDCGGGGRGEEVGVC